MMNEVQAVCLDVGWTLAYPHASMWEIFAALCTSAGAATTAEECERHVRGLWGVGQARAQEEFRAGARYSDSDADFAGQFAQLGAMIFSRQGVGDGHAELAQRFFQTFWNKANWSVFPEVHSVLTALRARGVKVGVLSNAPSDLPAFLDRLGISPFLDFSVVSAIEGVKKPDRRIFEVASARAGVPAHHILHVGDMYLEDILGATTAGFKALLIERGPRALFPSFRESEGRALAGAEIVNDLSQVLDRLRSTATR